MDQLATSTGNITVTFDGSSWKVDQPCLAWVAPKVIRAVKSRLAAVRGEVLGLLRMES